jgi:hypothetical protein
VPAEKTCILVELTDRSLCAYNYPDEESAASWHSECRQEWNFGRTLIFNLRGSSVNRFMPDHEMHDGDEVTHLALTTLEDAQKRGAICRDAVVFG